MSTEHTDALRPGAVVEARAAAAYADGRETAAKRGPFVNPWRGDSPLAVERVLAVMWARGYRDGNPIP